MTHSTPIGSPLLSTWLLQLCLEILHLRIASDILLFVSTASVGLELVGYDIELFVEQEPDKTAD
jgi:hypothetical protein